MKHLVDIFLEKTIFIGLKLRLIIITVMNLGVFVCFLFIGYIISRNVLQELSFNNIEMATNAAANSISSDINEINRSIVMFLRNMDVKELIDTGIDVEGEADTDFVIKKSQVESYINLMKEADCVEDIAIYLNDENNKLMDGKLFQPVSSIKESALMDRLLMSSLKNEWVCIHSPDNLSIQSSDSIHVSNGVNTILPEKLIYTTRIINSDDFNVTDGLICVFYDTDYLLRQLKNILVQSIGISVLIDNQNRIIAVHTNEIDREYDFLVSEISKPGFLSDKNNNWVYTTESGNTGWRLIDITLPGSFDINQIAIQNYRHYAAILIVLSAIWLLALVISFVYINDMVRRIRGVSEHLKISKDENEFYPIPYSNGNDEIQELIIQYNRLIDQLKTNLEQMYQLGISKRNADLKALQAQINPHFLYNTLELIDYYAFANEPDMVETIVQKLSSFYKLSLSSGKTLHSLWREIQLVQAYFDIQAIRLQENIKLVVDIPDELGQCQIPPITLQPLVENAIFHGYKRGKEEIKGTVLIMAVKEDNSVLISITDNGEGIDEAKAKEINSTLASSELTYENDEYYGIRNINQRLKLTFGETFGLKLSSKVKTGTTVYVRIPIS